MFLHDKKSINHMLYIFNNVIDAFLLAAEI